MSQRALEPGLRVGPYELEHKLGQGGMGQVWAAERGGVTKSGKRIALKLFEGWDEDTNDARLFLDEVRVAIHLRHPNIVRTYDIGQAGHRCYLAMELIEGPSLQALTRRLKRSSSRLPDESLALIGLDVASALAYAHQEASKDGKSLELIHRDVSPQNILLRPHGEAVLSDFGVAKSSAQAHQTRKSAVRGNPAYMSPEQVTGRELDHRSDLFSLGVVLYESATTIPLFMRGTPYESMNAVLAVRPTPLDEAVSGFPRYLSALIMACMSKAREERPSTAREIADAFGSYLERRGQIDTARDALSRLIEAGAGHDPAT